MATTTTKKTTRVPGQDERFNFRLSRDNKSLIEQAAALEGKNLKEFIQGAALAEARRILLERAMIVMESDERDAFLALLASDPKPTAAALAAAERYRAWRRRQQQSDAPQTTGQEPSR
jgi:uncharacterized protein (DUF1778 family)